MTALGYQAIVDGLVAQHVPRDKAEARARELCGSSILAVIPAKGFSRRVAGKNLRPLGGAPLFLWTVRAALAVRGYRVRVVLSTDDAEIATLGAREGAEILTRPPELSRDGVEMPDVALHALAHEQETNGDPDAVLILLPTSPFRTSRDIEAALSLHYGDPQRRNVVSVTSPRADFAHKLCLARDGVIYSGPALRDDRPGVMVPTQQGLMLNGAIWIARPECLTADGHVSAIGALPYVMDAVSGIDLDTPSDFTIAEAILAERGAAA